MRHAAANRRNIVLVGPMGSGKSHVGRLLAARLGLVFVDVDARIEADAGLPIPAIFAGEDEAGFRARESRILADTLARQGQVVATGGGAVLDADNRQRIRAHGFVVWLRVGVEAQLQRLLRDKSRPLLQRDDREQVLRDMAVLRDPLYREVADLTLETDTLSPADATAQLVVRLAAQWQNPEFPA